MSLAIGERRPMNVVITSSSPKLPLIYEDGRSCFVNYVCRGLTRIKNDTFQKQLEFYHTLSLGLFKKLESDKNEVDYYKFGVNETSVSVSISITYIANLFMCPN